MEKTTCTASTQANGETVELLHHSGKENPLNEFSVSATFRDGDCPVVELKTPSGDFTFDENDPLEFFYQIGNRMNIDSDDERRLMNRGFSVMRRVFDDIGCNGDIMDGEAQDLRKTLMNGFIQFKAYRSAMFN